MEEYILALDQGTTSSRALLFNKELNVVGISQKEITQMYPNSGWVEHCPEEIWQSQLSVAKEVLEKKQISAKQVLAIGITNQRETTIIWDKKTGKPIHNAIVWQDKRTIEYCKKIKDKGLEEYIHKNTGLVIDAYFSSSKIMWLLDKISGAKEKAKRGELLFGTVDSWLIWKFTNGKEHLTDVTNASRTMLYNINKLSWDEYICEQLEIPMQILPQVKPCNSDFGNTIPEIFDGVSIPINGIAGDQSASLIGHGCIEEGTAKNTYGTGCFVLMNTANKKVHSQNGLISTIAWYLNGKIEYAIEGSIFSGGSSIQWLRDGLGIIKHASETESMAISLKGNEGVYLVPAFAGLGAPYWDMEAKGTIVGLTRGSRKEHIARAALESIAYQTKDVIDVMEKDSGLKLKSLKTDGGAAKNNFLMQFQSDVLEVPVNRSKSLELTALGVAFISGIELGLWSIDRIGQKRDFDAFEPRITSEKKARLLYGWKNAIQKATNKSNAK
ncbi:MAG: glycerol kinase GlpK [Candidatus Caenarcaniphilales bacterium]|nr:glycerol kinase GlpK [Candidatus Caenarcaniphilales bacterium]